MVDALSRYPSPLTSSDTSAEKSVQHPYMGFNKNNTIVLDHSTLSPTPLTSIAALTLINPQQTKLEFAIDNETIFKLCSGYNTDLWCQKLLSASRDMPNFTIKDGL